MKTQFQRNPAANCLLSNSFHGEISGRVCENESNGVHKMLAEHTRLLEAVKKLKARERLIRHEHPTTLPLWWRGGRFRDGLWLQKLKIGP